MVRQIDNSRRPWLISPLPGFVKWMVRAAVRRRLQWLPLSEAQAEWWARQVKRLPGLFNDAHFRSVKDVSPGIRMDLGIVDIIERRLRTTGSWDSGVADALRRSLKPSDTFLDIGANVGYFTLMGSELVGPQGLVLAFEPSIRAIARLARNLQLSRSSNVLLFSFAAGETRAIERLCQATPSNVGASALRGDAIRRRTEMVPVVPLDDMLAGLNVRPTVVKLDVEGFELFALRGMRRTLAECQPTVVCELTDAFLRRHGSSAQELLQFMEGLGYRCRVLPGSAAETSWQITSDSDQVPVRQVDVIFETSAARLTKTAA
jgi:FkbM family methyltransferase